MNQKVKLKIGIDAIKKRKKELSLLIHSHGCLLCRVVLNTNEATCLDCIAREAEFSCGNYCDGINAILGSLCEQQEKWEQELEGGKEK